MTVLRSSATVLAVAVVLLTMIVALSYCRTRYELRAETTRKFAHTGLGLVTVTYPFLFDRLWPVVVLSAMVIATMIAARALPAVARWCGAAVHGVTRRSLGEFYFPLAAVVLFALTDGDPVRFGAPILTLTFADAAAALVGARFGRNVLSRAFAPKTVEGSAAFFVVAFLCVHAPLVALRVIDWPASLVVAGGCATVSTLIEALSADGTDNLFVPLGCYGALDVLLRSAA
jgi:phytol kinase